MGTAVRITRSAPRWISLPDPRYVTGEHWPYLAELAPGREYFRKVTGEEFAERYRAQLERSAALIEQKLPWLPVEHGRLVLLCFEKDVTDVNTCHRRQFAVWWEERTGREVPELGGGK